VLVGSAETGHLSHAARGYFSEIATAWERFFDRRRIRQCNTRLTESLSGCATHARSRWDGKRSGKNSLLSAPVAIAASAGHPRIESLSANFCNAILVFKSKRATLIRRGRGGVWIKSGDTKDSKTRKQKR